MVHLLSIEIVIRVIECMPILLKRLSSKYRVINDLLHTVTVFGVTGNSQQITRQLQMSICSARCFEILVRVAETQEEIIAFRMGNVRPVPMRQLHNFAYSG